VSVTEEKISLADLDAEGLTSTINELDEHDYQKQRKQLAKDAGVTVEYLDKLRAGSNYGLEQESNMAGKIVAMVKDRAEFFTDPDKVAYARFEVEGHLETWPVFSDEFKEWLTMLYYKVNKTAANEAAMKMAMQTMSGIARFEGETYEVWLRAAPYEDGYIIYLCNDKWTVVQISPHGYQQLPESPVIFRRTDKMRPLPYPGPVANIELLWEYVNIELIDQPLLIAWIIDCWRVDTHFTVAELSGLFGSAKSDTQDYIRSLVDPCKGNLKTAPSNVETIYVNAHNNLVVSFNNVSRLSPDQQDALCCVATGGEYTKRTLYSNLGETSLNIKRPAIFNGIKSLASAPDLLSRVLLFNLPQINVYKDPDKMKADFVRDKQAIFTGLLELLVEVLQILPNLSIPKPPRMVSFTYLGEAVQRAMGQGEGFFQTYFEKQQATVRASLEDSPVIMALIAYMESNPKGYEGNYQNLLTELNKYKLHSDGWPKSAKGLSNILRVHNGGLTEVGIKISQDTKDKKQRDGIHVRIQNVPKKDRPVREFIVEDASSPSSKTLPVEEKNNDGDVSTQSSHVHEAPESTDREHGERANPTSDLHPVSGDCELGELVSLTSNPQRAVANQTRYVDLDLD